jgi:hypothetical protein
VIFFSLLCNVNRLRKPFEAYAEYEQESDDGLFHDVYLMVHSLRVVRTSV